MPQITHAEIRISCLIQKIQIENVCILVHMYVDAYVNYLYKGGYAFTPLDGLVGLGL